MPKLNDLQLQELSEILTTLDSLGDFDGTVNLNGTPVQVSNNNGNHVVSIT